MDSQIYFLHECHLAKGVLVVIDVLRAFTTSAYAFSQGIGQMVLVETIEEAFKKKKQEPSLLLTGELHAEPVEGFDYDNSPSQMLKSSFSQERMLLRTSCGTKGVVNCSRQLLQGSSMFVASFVVVEATIERLLALKPSYVSLIVTSTSQGDEDLALADYMKLRLAGKNPSLTGYLNRVKASASAHRLLQQVNREKQGLEDLELALQANRFDFAMEAFFDRDEIVLEKRKRP